MRDQKKVHMRRNRLAIANKNYRLLSAKIYSLLESIKKRAEVLRPTDSLKRQNLDIEMHKFFKSELFEKNDAGHFFSYLFITGRRFYLLELFDNLTSLTELQKMMNEGEYILKQGEILANEIEKLIQIQGLNNSHENEN